MKKAIEGIKDFLYDSVDYIVILAVVLVVGVVIGWRLDVLFANDMNKTPVSAITEQESDPTEEATIPDETNNPNEDNDSIITVVEDTPSEETEDQANQESEETTENTQENNDSASASVDEVILVEIPSGSLGPDIADILIKKGLINSGSEFLKKAMELKLDTKLKSGKFEIKANSSLETIIKIIARAK